MNNDDHFPLPEGGKGRLRAILAGLQENQDKLNNHPIYKEGYDDGYNAAKENYRKLTIAVAKVYNIDADS